MSQKHLVDLRSRVQALAAAQWGQSQGELVNGLSHRADEVLLIVQSMQVFLANVTDDTVPKSGTPAAKAGTA